MSLSIVRKKLEGLPFGDSSILIPGNQPTAIMNLVKYRKFLFMAEELRLPFLEPIIAKIKTDDVLTKSITDAAYFNNPLEAEKKANFGNLVISNAKAVFDFLKTATVDQDENFINIKFPCGKNMEDIVKNLDSLQRSLQLAVMNDVTQGVVEVKGWEQGSLWVVIFLKTVAAVTLIGNVAWAAAVINEQRAKAEIAKEYLRSIKTKNDFLDNLKEKDEELINSLVDMEARNIADNITLKDNESIERLKVSIKLMSDLLLKGTEIHPSLNAGQEVKKLFPDLNSLPIFSKIKLLKESEDK